MVMIMATAMMVKGPASGSESMARPSIVTDVPVGQAAQLLDLGRSAVQAYNDRLRGVAAGAVEGWQRGLKEVGAEKLAEGWKLAEMDETGVRKKVVKRDKPVEGYCKSLVECGGGRMAPDFSRRVSRARVLF